VTTTLRGMTWSHPRGFDPMVATAKLWAEQTGTVIEWDKRSLQDFESFPVEELARSYDLLVIDHPHVGQITAEKCLAPLDVPSREAEGDVLAENSVGGSYPSYNYQGHQWALPIDAAAQVQISRPDKLENPVTAWDEVIRLAEQGKVILPLRAPHSLMCFYTLAANLGHPCALDHGEGLIGTAIGVEVLNLLTRVTKHIDRSNFDMDPIAASEALAEENSAFSLIPLAYGYVSYAMPGFRPKVLRFSDIPAAGREGPIGSTLGGTGIAVSAFSDHKDDAIAYAYWVASAPIQAALYAQSGGQPGHASGWDSDAVNAATGSFYRNTRKTLETAYIRPRHNGYMAFQHDASLRISKGLLEGDDPVTVIDDINRRFEASF
jgi:multiple sugar transport system substrate-binding protein